MSSTNTRNVGDISQPAAGPPLFPENVKVVSDDKIITTTVVSKERIITPTIAPTKPTTLPPKVSQAEPKLSSSIRKVKRPAPHPDSQYVSRIPTFLSRPSTFTLDSKKTHVFEKKVEKIQASQYRFLHRSRSRSASHPNSSADTNTTTDSQPSTTTQPVSRPQTASFSIARRSTPARSRPSTSKSRPSNATTNTAKHPVKPSQAIPNNAEEVSSSTSAHPAGSSLGTLVGSSEYVSLHQGFRRQQRDLDRLTRALTYIKQMEQNNPDFQHFHIKTPQIEDSKPIFVPRQPVSGIISPDNGNSANTEKLVDMRAIITEAERYDGLLATQSSAKTDLENTILEISQTPENSDISTSAPAPRLNLGDAWFDYGPSYSAPASSSSLPTASPSPIFPHSAQSTHSTHSTTASTHAAIPSHPTPAQPPHAASINTSTSASLAEGILYTTTPTSTSTFHPRASSFTVTTRNDADAGARALEHPIVPGYTRHSNTTAATTTTSVTNAVDSTLSTTPQSTKADAASSDQTRTPLHPQAPMPSRPQTHLQAPKHAYTLRPSTTPASLPPHRHPPVHALPRPRSALLPNVMASRRSSTLHTGSSIRRSISRQRSAARRKGYLQPTANSIHRKEATCGPMEQIPGNIGTVVSGISVSVPGKTPTSGIDNPGDRKNDQNFPKTPTKVPFYPSSASASYTPSGHYRKAISHPYHTAPSSSSDASASASSSRSMQAFSPLLQYNRMRKRAAIIDMHDDSYFVSKNPPSPSSITSKPRLKALTRQIEYDLCNEIPLYIAQQAQLKATMLELENFYFQYMWPCISYEIPKFCSKAQGYQMRSGKKTGNFEIPENEFIPKDVHRYTLPNSSQNESHFTNSPSNQQTTNNSVSFTNVDISSDAGDEKSRTTLNGDNMADLHGNNTDVCSHVIAPSGEYVAISSLSTRIKTFQPEIGLNSDVLYTNADVITDANLQNISESINFSGNNVQGLHSMQKKPFPYPIIVDGFDFSYLVPGFTYVPQENSKKYRKLREKNRNLTRSDDSSSLGLPPVLSLEEAGIFIPDFGAPQTHAGGDGDEVGGGAETKNTGNEGPSTPPLSPVSHCAPLSTHKLERVYEKQHHPTSPSVHRMGPSSSPVRRLAPFSPSHTASQPRSWLDKTRMTTIRECKAFLRFLLSCVPVIRQKYHDIIAAEYQCREVCNEEKRQVKMKIIKLAKEIEYMRIYKRLPPASGEVDVDVNNYKSGANVDKIYVAEEGQQKMEGEETHQGEEEEGEPNVGREKGVPVCADEGEGGESQDTNVGIVRDIAASGDASGGASSGVSADMHSRKNVNMAVSTNLQDGVIANADANSDADVNALLNKVVVSDMPSIAAAVQQLQSQPRQSTWTDGANVNDVNIAATTVAVTPHGNGTAVDADTSIGAGIDAADTKNAAHKDETRLNMMNVPGKSISDSKGKASSIGNTPDVASEETLHILTAEEEDMFGYNAEIRALWIYVKKLQSRRQRQYYQNKQEREYTQYLHDMTIQYMHDQQKERLRVLSDDYEKKMSDLQHKHSLQLMEYKHQSEKHNYDLLHSIEKRDARILDRLYDDVVGKKVEQEKAIKILHEQEQYLMRQLFDSDCKIDVKRKELMAQYGLLEDMRRDIASMTHTISSQEGVLMEEIQTEEEAVNNLSKQVRVQVWENTVLEFRIKQNKNLIIRVEQAMKESLEMIKKETEEVEEMVKALCEQYISNSSSGGTSGDAGTGNGLSTGAGHGTSIGPDTTGATGPGAATGAGTIMSVNAGTGTVGDADLSSGARREEQTLTPALADAGCHSTTRAQIQDSLSPKPGQLPFEMLNVSSLPRSSDIARESERDEKVAGSSMGTCILDGYEVDIAQLAELLALMEEQHAK